MGGEVMVQGPRCGRVGARLIVARINEGRAEKEEEKK